MVGAAAGPLPPMTLVAAVARNGVIGADGGMPWHLPDDLRRFKRLTMGAPMIMGRRTFDAIGRPLPGRRTVVITRDPLWGADGVEVTHSVADALALLAGAERVSVVGGGEIYRQTIGDAAALEITEIDLEVAGDTTFPAIDGRDWARVSDEAGDGCRYVRYERRA
ncbi:dihydrofolate reductase [Nakamurella flava]|uniref:Dihydrofolate reductase n=2 Tax=Nakamurella flava TaxID=2576308 RepID=A0A4U6QN53_9ACTN|nr:dihydrofolate reductase [Nakamurella flava]